MEPDVWRAQEDKLPDEIKDIEKMYLDAVEQPIEGLLYDLDLLPEQLIPNVDTAKWLAMKAIIALKHKLEEERHVHEQPNHGVTTTTGTTCTCGSTRDPNSDGECPDCGKLRYMMYTASMPQGPIEALICTCDTRIQTNSDGTCPECGRHRAPEAQFFNAFKGKPVCTCDNNPTYIDGACIHCHGAKGPIEAS